MEDELIFERKVIKLGDSKAITISEELQRYINNPEEVKIMPKKGKHGKYLAIWNKQQ